MKKTIVSLSFALLICIVSSIFTGITWTQFSQVYSMYADIPGNHLKYNKGADLGAMDSELRANGEGYYGYDYTRNVFESTIIFDTNSISCNVFLASEQIITVRQFWHGVIGSNLQYGFENGRIPALIGGGKMPKLNIGQTFDIEIENLDGTVSKIPVIVVGKYTQLRTIPEYENNTISDMLKYNDNLIIIPDICVSATNLGRDKIQLLIPFYDFIKSKTIGLITRKYGWYLPLKDFGGSINTMPNTSFYLFDDTKYFLPLVFTLISSISFILFAYILFTTIIRTLRQNRINEVKYEEI
ncbi:MAG: hypothetical protein LBU04_01980 [Christensenellaceae bacterium]|jgi:hypothetical protein|nr:hypothetical protein [Christensenellaceae bacterium]